MGMFPDIPRWEVQLKVQKGDLLVMFTDGVSEAEDPDGEQFSTERLNKLMQHCIRQNMNADQIKERLIHRLKEFIQGDYFIDDVTFVIIKIL